ncbi:MAG: Y-family DNA polymerase, partial [Ignavibacteriaceae bacterium]
MDEIYAIVDCNCFYVSCERIFNPKLKGKPVVVLSNNDGCIISRSDEAKALGIGMGAPFFEFEKLIKKNNVSVFSSNYSLYGDISGRIMNVLSQYTPKIEVYSIDEAFLSLKGYSYLNLTDYARDIKDKLKKWIGVPVSIGVAKTKTLAKIANRYAKKKLEFNGVLNIIEHKNIDAFLEQTNVENIWGIGRGYKERLHKYGIKNALQLKNAPDKFILKN